MKNRFRLINALSILIFIAGILVLLYAPVSKYLMKKRQLEISVTYDRQVSGLSEAVVTEEWRKAMEYNDILAGRKGGANLLTGSGRSIPGNYYKTLNVGGIMGVIRIPAINVKLPIYHGTGEASLQKGVGHIAKTALPIGGKGNHTVLTGHRALADAEMFDGLVRLESGDIFLIDVLGETLAYQVDLIQVVEPEDLSALKAKEDEDYITLITCTPYAVNSHRLLVRGVRTDYETEVKAEEGIKTDGGFCCISLIFILLLLLLLNRRKKKEETDEGDAAG